MDEYSPVFRGAWNPRISSATPENVSGTPVIRGSISNAEYQHPSPLSVSRVNQLNDALANQSKPAPLGASRDNPDSPTLDRISEDHPDEDTWSSVQSTDDLHNPDNPQTSTFFLGYDSGSGHVTQQPSQMTVVTSAPRRIDSGSSRTYASPCFGCGTMLKFTSQNPSGDTFAMHCSLCHTVTGVELQPSAFPVAYGHPQSPMQPQSPSQPNYNISVVHNVYYHQGMPPAQPQPQTPPPMTPDPSWSGGISPGWYFVAGKWTTDTKATFEGLALRIRILDNGTVGGFVLQKKNQPLPQFTHSGIGGIWGGKSSGELNLKIMSGAALQITFEGKWKKTHWSGHFYQLAKKFKEADKSVRGKFEYTLARLH